MQQVLFATSNSVKFLSAQHVCREFDIELRQVSVDITELQAEDGEIIVRDKAEKAFDMLHQPVVVCDDSWIIPGLNGFPGPYMKSVNTWFTPEDWLRLTLPLKNREIVLRQYIVFQNDDEQHLFAQDVRGIILKEIRGTSVYPHSALVSFDAGKHSDAEFQARQESAHKHLKNSWHLLGEWLRGQSL